jgi:hypothetical protein
MIHVVDDDEGLRASLVSLLESYDWTVAAYASADEFLRARRPEGPCCLILDIQMPGADGLDLQAELKRLGQEHSIIFLTGHGTIPLTVKAMREGAVEFLTKPFTEEQLMRAVEMAMHRETARMSELQDSAALQALYDKLTPREKEVFAHVATGRMNKVIAGVLNVSEVTIKVHRRRVMDKFGIRTLADLVRIASQLGIELPQR